MGQTEWRSRINFFLVWNYEGLGGIKREIKDLRMQKSSKKRHDCGLWLGLRSFFRLALFIVSHVALSSAPSLDLLYPMRKNLQ